ncbi:diguanylate cyclase (GGDEF) domain-containing protein [Humidesulfovibrio mexicanus]|uniref:diguanylate cyclase n=1 Tax=Humidesulfovibrio mexicanus TaxID=147047 RepID=A0A239A6Z3_9BACT|nr:GGDEF domain-containing protein [Humidesulfovibrio mexicanus]SNR91269.1 diguanylate cyclase (GGDEF) domain-containing protein [Humidesulfovibrio mexicanus]
MLRAEHPEIMWGLGLDPDTVALIEKSAGPGFALRNLPPDALPWMRGQEGCGQAAWIPLEVWRGLSKVRRKACREVDTVRRILIVPEEAEPLETEEVLSEGFLSAVRAPLTRYKVRDALLRLRELDSLSADLRRKTEEVMLERELLARKSSHLSFLNRVLSRASASLDVGTILSKVRGDLRHLLPVEALCAVFWTRIEGGAGLDAEMYLHCRMAPPEHEAWGEVLRSGAERLAGVRVRECRQFCLTGGGRHMAKAPAPDSGRLLMLPLSAGGESFGCLALLTSKGLRLAKDQVETLNAAVNHLALALRNALLYRQVKSMADHDGLTGIANRRRFEERLEEEARRHGRYDLPLSLILLDIDHFKRINDTHGHQTGDAVLRGVAGLLAESLRGTDFPARYGGEEFAVILPHTSREQALLLAERIRQRVSQREFGQGETLVRLTVSAGVSALGSGEGGPELVSLADQALYLAKDGGRNRVVVAAPAEGAAGLGCANVSAPVVPAEAKAPEERLRAGGGM